MLKRISDIFVVFYVGFISIFALDMFGAGYVWYELAIGLFMHLLPTIIIALSYYLLRKKLIWRGAAFIFLALFSIIFFNAKSDPIALVIITAPLTLIAIFSLIIYNKQRR